MNLYLISSYLALELGAICISKFDCIPDAKGTVIEDGPLFSNHVRRMILHLFP